MIKLIMTMNLLAVSYLNTISKLKNIELCPRVQLLTLQFKVRRFFIEIIFAYIMYEYTLLRVKSIPGNNCVRRSGETTLTFFRARERQTCLVVSLCYPH